MNVPLFFDQLSDAPHRDPLTIALRAFVSKAPEPEVTQKKAKHLRRARPSAGPSEYTLIFDTETTTDASQRLRIGCYQFRKGDVVLLSGKSADRRDPARLRGVQGPDRILSHRRVHR
jgi:hypothetical protein